MNLLIPLLISLAGNLVARGLLSLGMGFVSYQVLVTIASRVADQITILWGTGLAPVLSMLELAGIGQAIGIILGGMMARATLGASIVLQKVTQ